MVNSQKDWTNFKKQEVRQTQCMVLSTDLQTNNPTSSNPRNSGPMTSILRLSVAAFAGLMYTPSQEAGAKSLFPSASGMKLLAMLLRLATRWLAARSETVSVLELKFGLA